MPDIVERLRETVAFSAHGKRHKRFRNPDGPAAADEIEALRADLAEARETIIAFAGPWATQYARDFGLPDGHLHPTHYDILAKAGARMDDFTRTALTQTKDTTDDALSSITGDE